MSARSSRKKRERKARAQKQRFTEFHRAHYSNVSKEQIMSDPALVEAMTKLKGDMSISEAADNIMNQMQGGEVWKNNIYQVHKLHCLDMHNRPMIHLSIKRIDKNPICDWRHMQRIKNKLVGDEYEAVQLFPAESRVVDMANQYHLWCLPNKQQFPIGWETGIKIETSTRGGKQRIFV